MPRPACIAVLALAAGLLAALPVRAQWQPNGALVSGGSPGDINLVAPDGTGGAYVAWRTYSPVTQEDVYLQHITASGATWSGWPATGIPLIVRPALQGVGGLIPDGDGGVLAVMGDYESDPVTRWDHRIQRTSADGMPAPGWPLEGLRLRIPGRPGVTASAGDAAGGVFLIWNDDRNYLTTQNEDVYGIRVTGDGAIAPGWPADGMPIATSPQVWSSVGDVIPDGEGGAYFLYYDGRNGVPNNEAFGLRLHADGTLAPGWPAEGRLLSPGQYYSRSCSDGAGGFYLWTSVQAQIYDGPYYLRRIGPDGNLYLGWPPGGVLFCNAPGQRQASSIVPDGQGGAIMSWTDYRGYETGGTVGVYAIRVLGNGAIAPGWPANGTRIDDPDNLSFDSESKLAPDDLGGAYVVWDQDGPSSIQHLTATGQPAPGWPQFGMRLATTAGQQGARVTADGEGGAILAWHESCCGRQNVWAQKYVATGIVAANLSLVSATAESDRVLLEWYAADGAGLEASVERREGDARWRPLASVTADGTGHLRYEDRDVAPGARYVYRLVYLDEGVERHSDETTVEVPAAFELALEGFQPNPAIGAPLVSFTLPRSGAGRIELFDLAGRRVASRDVTSLPAGQHLLKFEDRAPLEPGVYVVRLTHGATTVVSRGVVVR